MGRWLTLLMSETINRRVEMQLIRCLANEEHTTH